MGACVSKCANSGLLRERRHVSFKSLTGPNGYPDGTCTDLRRSGPYGSFQIVSLDPGCSVTIYSNDTTNDPCSASPDSQALGQLIACYNTTYHYYSIDMCDPAAARSSSPPELVPKSHTGAIVGGVVGGVLGIAVLIGVVFWHDPLQRAARLPAK
ncbi:hypothetical protein C7974DRAFT_1317 [Boeremia exigua]|uniref:uncharacterized protein n=1 Tax=Boeremia exigua TaxID=749465 RepID=UPI001E8E91F3|nr:uncharacterized protein C7974DRAFT_1317 [Boeremia exigua]KAH6643603.1 hypothetical protein C7974DRAFT_1317 [Boeremia exigua]